MANGKLAVDSYCTQNTALAMVLQLMGFGPPKGRALVKNLYTQEQLDAANATAFELRDRGVPGRVTYLFDRTKDRADLFNDVVRWWDEQNEELRKGEAEGFTLASCDAEDFVKALAIGQHFRRSFAQAWREVVPTIAIQNAGVVDTVEEDNGGKRVRHPGYKEFSANISPENFARLMGGD